MRLVHIIIFSILLFPKYSISENIFNTSEYLVEFNSTNINVKKSEEINIIKLKSFNSLLKKLLTKKVSAC